MSEIKLGGGHYICEKCGDTVFGSKLHVCKVWEKALEERIQNIPNIMKMFRNIRDTEKNKEEK
jgi:hypothetical protein